MSKYLTFLFISCSISIFAQKKQKSTIGFYANTGFNYGIKKETFGINNYTAKTKITPQGGLGLRKSNKKYNRFLDMQIGVATSNNYVQNANESVLLGGAPNEIGAGKGIHTFLHLKISGLQTISLCNNKKNSFNGIFGAGIQYIPLLSNNNEEIFNDQNNNYNSTYILYDFKYTKENNIITPHTTKRPVSLQAYCGVQFFPTIKKIKNFGFEFFWNPSITPALYGIYDVNINYAIYAKGNAHQMLSSFGLKLLYTFNVLLDK